MIFILIFILSSLGIGTAVCLQYKNEYNNPGRFYGFMTGFLWSAAISSILISMIWALSYQSYVKMLKIPFTIEQKLTAIDAYRVLGVNSFGEDQKSVTDVKYNDYQKEMAKMITDLRDSITKYNEILIGKRAFKANPLWSWLIFSPPVTAQPMALSDYLKQ